MSKSSIKCHGTYYFHWDFGAALIKLVDLGAVLIQGFTVV